MSNHLGNVLVTVSDKKLGDSIVNGHYVSWKPDVVTANDYYPFGMLMPGRGINSPAYRYGFNGKEKDDEVKGSGVQYDYGFRIYDARLGRFLSIDPLTRSYPMLTPYQFASNRPIDGFDLDGNEWSVRNVDGITEFTVHIKVYNDSRSIQKFEDVNKLLNGGIDKKGRAVDGYKQFAERSFGADFKDSKYRLNIVFEITSQSSTSCDYNLNNEFQLILRDATGTDNGDGTITYSGGATYIGQTQVNHMFSTLSVDGDKLRDKKLLFRNFLHELMHTGGLKHPWINDALLKDIINNPKLLENFSHRKNRIAFGNLFGFSKKQMRQMFRDIKEINRKNIMNSDEERGGVDIPKTHNPNDKDIRESQYGKIKRTVEGQQ